MLVLINFELSLDCANCLQVLQVECWQLRRNAEDWEDAGGGKKAGSVLDRAEDRHIMGLAGMQVNQSDGLRRAEAPIEE